MVIKSLFFEKINIDIYPDALIIIDEHNNISSWNKNAKEVFGYEKEEIKGRNISLLFDYDTDKIYQSLDEGKSCVITAKNKDCKDIFVEISCKNIEKTEDIIISARDVTRNQQIIQNLLIEYENTSTVCQHRSNFLSGLSAELKNPLHSIVGFSQGLLDKLCGDLNEKQKKYVSIINKNANNLLSLIENITMLSILESGQIVPEYKVFDVVLQLNILIAEFMPAIEKKKLALNVDTSNIVKKIINSDENLLKQILRTIIDNAVKFTDSGEIKIQLIHPDYEMLKRFDIASRNDIDEKSHIMFLISDTGCGMNEETQKAIFDEYDVSYRSIVKKYGGTGLSLPVTSKYLKLMGGNILFESKSGHGSVFSFIIPCEKLASL